MKKMKAYMHARICRRAVTRFSRSGGNPVVARSTMEARRAFATNTVCPSADGGMIGLLLERAGDEREHLRRYGIVRRADAVVEALVCGIAADDLCGNTGGLEHCGQTPRLCAGVGVARDVEDE